ncbi:SGNH hydrolase domain-containing protein [soil metagenome]
MPSAPSLARPDPAAKVTLPAPKPAAKKKALRPDIQGLRTLAVVAVIFAHLVNWPIGGFVGVDVFFVISGFLITGQLYREHERKGRISFADFYRRRARRILPISTLVLVVTVLASYGIFLASRAGTILTDALWSLFFSANWHFAAIGTNYWAHDGSTSPLQHYWSLAVEEQFYVIWPWILVIVLGIALRKTWSARTGHRMLVAVMSIAVAGSFIWALVSTADNPTFAYFSTFVRAWELGVGALLAVLTGLMARIPNNLRPVLGWIGFIGIIVSIFTVSESDGFPAPWAAAPVLSTALVIAAGTGGQQRFLWPLSNPVSGYIGDISYSLYLWHFPVIVLIGSLFPTRTPLFFVVTIGLMFGLSVLSYHYVENPIRRSAWLETGIAADRKRFVNRTRPKPHHPYLTAYAFLLKPLSVVVLVGLIALFLVPRPVPVEASASAVSSNSSLSPLQQKIETALAAKTWPTLDPAVDTLGTLNWQRAAAGAAKCSDIASFNVSKCVTGPADATKTVAVLGDSYGIAWMPGIRSALEGQGFSVHPFTMGECPSSTLDITRDDGSPFPECSAHREWSIGQITALNPDLVVLADASNNMGRLTSGAGGSAAAGEVKIGLEKTLTALGPLAAKTVVLAPPPDGKTLQTCVTRFSAPSDCESVVTDAWRSFTGALGAAASAGGAKYVDTESWFCSEQGECPGFIGTTPVRADSGHLTQAYSAQLGPELAKVLTVA